MITAHELAQKIFHHIFDERNTFADEFNFELFSRRGFLTDPNLADDSFEARRYPQAHNMNKFISFAGEITKITFPCAGFGIRSERDWGPYWKWRWIGRKPSDDILCLLLLSFPCL